MVAPHIERMKEELEQLSDRILKLSSFICVSPVFAELPADEKQLMRGQWAAMLEYRDILETRIDLAERSQ